MRAVVQDAYGPPDVLRIEDIPRPTAAADEVLVHVHAAGIDPGVWHLTTGRPYFVRLMGVGLRAPKSRVPGMAFSGIVETVGSDVARFRPGDAVYGVGTSVLAEYAVAKPEKIATMPANLSFDQAAAVPISAATALQGVRDSAGVQPGQRVLIIGAGGGVGSYAVQLAKNAGAHVTGVCSGGKADLVRSLGADDIIDYTTTDLAMEQRRFDVIIDTAGNRPLSTLRRLLSDRGTLVLVGGEGGGSLTGGFERLLHAGITSMFVKQSLKPLVAKDTTEDLDELRALVESGALTPLIDRTFGLSQTPDAIRYLEEGHARGKIVVTVG